MRYEVIVKMAPLLSAIAIAIARGGWMALGPISRDLANVLWQQFSVSLRVDPAAVKHSSFDIRS